MTKTKTRTVVLPGGIVIVPVAVRTERGRRIWTAANGCHWIEPT